MKTEIKNRIAMIQNGEVPEGYKKTKVGIVPSEWEVKKLSEIATKISDKVGNKKLETLSISAGKGFVNQAQKFGKELSGKQYVNYTIIKKGDFSYNKGNSKRYPQGCIYMLKNRDIAAVPNVFNSFSLDNQIADFFEQLFIKGFLNKQLYKYINSGVRNDGLLNLYDDDFYSCKLPIPPLHEQQKIAEILTTQDKVIELKEKLISEKEQQKKYLMQNLLTGRKRLKGFSGEWKKVKLGEIGDFYQPQTISQNAMSVVGYNVYGANGIIGKYKDYNHENEQIMITCRGSTCGTVNMSEKHAWITGNAMVFNVDKSNVNKLFMYYLCRNSDFRKIISGSGQPQITFEPLNSFKSSVPPLDEQNAIAEILSTADREIELLKADLAEEKQKKKALMQLLLTGIVRV